MKIVCLTTLFALLVCFGNSQDANFSWSTQTGSTGQDRGVTMAIDSQGNLFLGGEFSGTVDFDPGEETFNMTSEGSSDVFIRKTDPSGNLLWVKQFGGADADTGMSLALDENDDVYFTGAFQGQVDFDPGDDEYLVASNGNRDAFIVKVLSDGEFGWAHNYGGEGFDFGRSISVGNDGYLYSTGTFKEVADLDPSEDLNEFAALGGADIYILKLSLDGEIDWVNHLAGESDGTSVSIEADEFGNVYVSGLFKGEFDFDSDEGVESLGAAGSVYGDVFLLKLNSEGEFSWVRQMGGVWSDQGNAISFDSLGNVILVGEFSGTADFNPADGTYDLTSDGNKDIFVIKLDPNGELIWVSQYGTNEYDTGRDVVVDSVGDIYVTGIIDGSIGFNEWDEDFDVFIYKLNSNGELLWSKEFGGNGSARGDALVLDDDQQLFICGAFRFTVDFDPGIGTHSMTSAGSYDIFVQSFIACQVVTSIDTRSECSPFTWIDGLEYVEDNQSAYFVYEDGAVNGCDSVVTLDLTVNVVSDVGTSLSGMVLTANAENASYQWLDCNDNYTPIPGAIGQFINVVPGESYAVEIMENNCLDTSECVNIIPTNLIEIEVFDEFEIFPNPVGHELFVEFEKIQKNVDVQIFSISGQLLEYRSFSQSSLLQMELKLESGFYLLVLSDESGRRTKRRFVKE